jgi:alkanesulfonate monooxygenase SsuD/methylene tetrahydromethanopterin reductase-like flavin-dependent oxidoreductase (luciferase family)
LLPIHKGRRIVEIGVGLPSSVPTTPGSVLLEWARRADAGPYSSLGVVDRLRFDSYEPLSLLAAAAAVTNRIKLATMIVVSPLRATALLAKEAATVDALSGGRLVLGVALGARHDDYRTAGIDPAGRGSLFTEQLVAMRAQWDDEEVGPRATTDGGPTLLVGGSGDAAFQRVANHADGYVHGGGPARAFERAANGARAAWSEAGRPGRPLLWGQSYFALGDDAAERGREYMRSYYAFTGPFVEKIVAATLTSAQDVVQVVQGYEAAGCDELVLFPAVSDPDQLDRLADALGSI